jgi:hypothetical protein
LKEKEDDGCSSHSPIKPSIELRRSVISITKRNFGEEIFKYKGAIHPLGEAFRPLNLFLCNILVVVKDKTDNAIMNVIETALNVNSKCDCPINFYV